MIDISRKIYTEYKAANIIAIITNNNSYIAFALRIAIITVFIMEVFIITVLQQFNFILSLIQIVLFVFLVFFVYSFATKYILKKSNMAAKVPFITPQEIARNSLKDILISNGMYSKEGLEYLISIYSKANSIRKFSWVAIFGIILAAFINNIIYFLMFGNGEQLLTLTSNINFAEENLEAILIILLIFLVSIAVFKNVFKNTKTLFFMLFGFRYSSLLYDLEYFILPELISIPNLVIK